MTDEPQRATMVSCGSLHGTAQSGSTLAALPFILERANDEIQTVLGNLRDSRVALESLESAAVQKLQQTSEKLREVTSATEVAATDILDALDRAGTAVDALEVADQAGDKARAQELRDELRGEIFGMMGALQFQDITTQQLTYAASVLTDMESRLILIAKLFDPNVASSRGVSHGPDPRTFDPGATTRDAEGRQALADEVFVVR
ncbi:MAG TPA: hypothetical protein VGD56_04230 [Gemmatirosa sp.]